MDSRASLRCGSCGHRVSQALLTSPTLRALPQGPVDAEKWVTEAHEEYPWKVGLSGIRTRAKIDGLEPGRCYAARVTCTPMLSNFLGQVEVVPAPPSETIYFATLSEAMPTWLARLAVADVDHGPHFP